MNPSEKHILEIDSVELSFGDRVILSSVYLAVETGGATASVSYTHLTLPTTPYV